MLQGVEPWQLTDSWLAQVDDSQECQGALINFLRSVNDEFTGRILSSEKEMLGVRQDLIKLVYQKRVSPKMFLKYWFLHPCCPLALVPCNCKFKFIIYSINRHTLFDQFKFCARSYERTSAFSFVWFTRKAPGCCVFHEKLLLYTLKNV